MIIGLEVDRGGDIPPSWSVCSISDGLTNFREFGFYVINGCWNGYYKDGKISYSAYDCDDYDGDNDVASDTYRVRPIVVQTEGDDMNQYVKRTEKYTGDELNNLEEMLSNTYEQYRIEIMNRVGHQRWYKILELEDEHKESNPIGPMTRTWNILPEVIEQLNYGEGALKYYKLLLNVRLAQASLRLYHFTGVVS